jgi:DNA-binding winged helix-turn-helix (wHTH) protein/TolB-like protein/Tfp pilus assembly protein PilF
MGREQRPFPVFRVGPWEVDSASNELRKGDATVRIEPKAMEVLVVLSEKVGQVVSRDQLLDSVWPGVVVGDAALTQVVIKLRKALADDPQEPRYIETIPKRGYRLLPQPEEYRAFEAVERAQDESTTVPTKIAEVPRAREPKRFKGQLWALTIGVALAVAAGYGVLVPNRESRFDQALLKAIEQPNEEQLSELAESLPTIAVAPFDSTGNDVRAATLAKGISWELADRLGRISELRVISADGRDASIDRLSKVRYLVSGFVQGEEDQIVVNAKLVDRQTGSQLWAARFQSPVRETLGIQNDIAQRLVASLPIEVSEAERRRLAYAHTRSLDAYDAYLSGLSAFLVRSPEENQRARELYLKAISIDPQFARAYAGVALTHIEDFRLWKDQNREEAAAEALRMADAAIQINPNSREAHWVRSYLAMNQRRFDAAIRYVREALSIDPSYADAYALLAWIHIFEGEPGKAIPMMRAAMHLNPGAGHIYFSHLGTAFYLAGDQEQALINLKEAQSRNMADVQTKVWLALSLLAAGRKEEAMWEVDEIHALRPQFSGQAWLDRMPMKIERDKIKLAAAIQELGI